MISRKWAIMTSLVLMLVTAKSQAIDIYVRKNANPFAAPYYVFSSTANGLSETLELVKGSTYVFIGSDLTGHPFNIGSAWRTAEPSISSSSTAPNGTGYYSSSYVVSGVGSIQNGQRLTITIPTNFSGSVLKYYCYSHSRMIASLAVVGLDLDSDSDGIPNSTDLDDDGDGVADALDAFPLDGEESIDTDSDGVGNNSDLDDDGDGVADTLDAFPLDSNETLDSDSDGIGNNADTDDDGDGLTDTQESTYGTNALSKDSDSDGYSDKDEIDLSTDPLDANSVPSSSLSMILIKAFLDKQKAASQVLEE